METSLGIDIHGDYASLTLAGKALNRLTLLRSHWFQLFPEQGPEETGKRFVEETRRFLERERTSPRNVVLGLPRRDIILHALSLPSPDAAALDGIVQLELDRHLAAPIDSLQVSYHALPLDDNLYHVLVAAAKKNLAEDYTYWVSQSGVEAKQVSLGLAGQISILTNNRAMTAGLHAIMDIGPVSVEISLWKDKKVLISRYVPRPTENLSELFFQKTAQEKGTEPVLETFSKFLVETLELTLDGCKALESDETLETIHVFGGGYIQQELIQRLQSKTDITVQAATWMGLMKKEPPPETVPAFQLTSLGLALQPFLKNRFVLDLKAGGKALKQNGTLWTVSAVGVVLLLAVATAIFLHQKNTYEATLASLNRQLQEIEPQAHRLKAIDREFSALSDRIDLLNAIDRRSPVKLPILLELSLILPKNTWVTRINIQPGKVEIKGYSTAASGLIPKLEASPMFREVTFKGSVIKRRGKENFTIQLELEPNDHEKAEA